MFSHGARPNSESTTTQNLVVRDLYTPRLVNNELQGM